ncbi:hypothetical protein CYLTODRAFT_347478 [Cylindrobasidium torrendii FP15055 ss-10]|uniref:Uncharacterized protein n=1 Tax=Cylindrobasidium torrendii FP15055 ss-10 TaxID=1314674 RepID=A0A0D7BKC7_9AGAR|nr:hypothetical protein CYLTODRAFT_347478 [Cylindrobasidium torrendii FP15055 ss-10]
MRQPEQPTEVISVNSPVPNPFVVEDDEPTPPEPEPSTPNVNKAVPPPPPVLGDDSEEEEETPDLYLPGLVLPTMFLPIPNTDPLSTLLTKYIYPPDKRPARDASGQWQDRDFHTLVMTNSWRALARMVRDRLVTTNPEDLVLVLGLWYIRLACLARLRLFNQTAAECTNLFSVLNGIVPATARDWVFERVLPFELEVMQARLSHWAGDPMGYLDALSALLAKCRRRSRQCGNDDTSRAMWKERGTRVSLMLASQLMEMKDFGAATKLIEPLCSQQGTAAAALRSTVARIYLQAGQIHRAAAHFAFVDQDPEVTQDAKDMNAALLASANGEWERSAQILFKLLETDAENYVAVNNIAVALLGQGKVMEGIATLERALKTSPSTVVVSEPFLFNLSTLYELRSATAADKKRDLLIEVAQWSGDGLRTSCLKMPTN